MANPEVTHDEKVRRRLEVLYTRQTREKQIFMEELKEYRRRKDKQMLQSMIVEVGPKWYQALSVPQRTALDTLEFAIYQDLLEGRPKRASVIMHRLGLVPRPSNSELMTCMHFGRDDPKKMLAHLYLISYGYPIEGKRASYCLNARLMLSAILYLGLDNLYELLKKTFAPEPSTVEPPPKPIPRPRRKLPSPYLTKMVAALYEPRKFRRPPPQPLPKLTELNEPYEEEPIIPRPPPPPPPPPPPKKRLPRSFCDDLAGIVTIGPQISPTNVPAKKTTRSLNRKSKGSKTSLLETSTHTHKKKSYGLNAGRKRKKPIRRRKPVAPSTGLANAQYTINGVYTINGKSMFILGSISILPAQGELIHGGYSTVNGVCITIHCGFRGWPPPPKPDPCDCIKKWHDSVFEYVKEHKCYCGHYFDYGNEGTFPQDELPYFTKPTRNAPYKFNYDTIFDLDPKRLHIEKEFKQVWETDSMLRTDEGAIISPDSKKKKKRKEKGPKFSEADGVQEDPNKVSNEKYLKAKTASRLDVQKRAAEADDDDGRAKATKDKKTKQESKRFDDTESSNKQRKSPSLRASNTCLGLNPKPQDYLKCALRTMRQRNVAARLPDLHLVPELKEWMRRRLYGSLTGEEKKEFLRKSTTYWRMFTTLGEKGFGHVAPPKEAKYTGHTTWKYKQSLNDTFRQYTYRYRLSMFRSHAYVTNLLWRSMYQAEFPDKKFREIYFSYLFGRLEDIQLIHPYTSKEAVERKLIIAKKRYICLPAGYEPRT
nr:uncharacterized protein LOC110374478 [Helicoverpa armigera]